MGDSAEQFFLLILGNGRLPPCKRHRQKKCNSPQVAQCEWSEWQLKEGGGKV